MKGARPVKALIFPDKFMEIFHISSHFLEPAEAWPIGLRAGGRNRARIGDTTNDGIPGMRVRSGATGEGLMRRGSRRPETERASLANNC